MGLERLVLKSEKLVGHFIANPQSPFYETDQFQGILNRILAQPTGYRLAQKDDKLRLVIEPIRHIKDAFQKLEALQNTTNWFLDLRQEKLSHFVATLWSIICLYINLKI